MVWANFGRRRPFIHGGEMGDSGVKARGEGLLCPQRLQWHGGEGERGQGGPWGAGERRRASCGHGDGDSELGEVGDDDGFAKKPLAPVLCFFSFFFLLFAF